MNNLPDLPNHIKFHLPGLNQLFGCYGTIFPLGFSILVCISPFFIRGRLSVGNLDFWTVDGIGRWYAPLGLQLFQHVAQGRIGDECLNHCPPSETPVITFNGKYLTFQGFQNVLSADLKIVAQLYPRRSTHLIVHHGAF